MNPDTTTVAEFGRWLAMRQKIELDAMQATTGLEFNRHMSAFTSLSAAYGAILIFERETKYQAHPCAAPRDEV
jgi:hypothetical protein